MKSTVIKRSIVVDGHKTSVSLEDAFWESLKDIAARRSLSLAVLVKGIDTARKGGNLSSAIRLFVLDNVKNPTADFMRPAHDGADGDARSSA